MKRAPTLESVSATARCTQSAMASLSPPRSISVGIYRILHPWVASLRTMVLATREFADNIDRTCDQSAGMFREAETPSGGPERPRRDSALPRRLQQSERLLPREA